MNNIYNLILIQNKLILQITLKRRNENILNTQKLNMAYEGFQERFPKEKHVVISKL